MLLFCDGFENFDVFDLWRKWGVVRFNKTLDANSMYTNPYAKIVSGEDTTVNPPQPRARHGRALAYKRFIVLGTPIEKSRTVFAGFAFRTRTASSVKVTFTCDVVPNRVAQSRGFRPADTLDPDSFNAKYHTVATCDISIKADRIDCVWSFFDTSLPKQYTQVISNTNLLSGDWYYYQLGFTTLGADPNNPQGWVENRIGNRANKRNRIENIRTTVSNGRNSFYVNGVSFKFSDSSGSLWSCVDDIYIANDDGIVNNDFLGNISIRSNIPVAEGVSNDAVPHGGNTMYRMEHVRYGDDGIVRTNPYAANNAVVDGEPLAVGADPRESYLSLLEQDDLQLIRFTHTNYGGAEPNIVAVAITAMARSMHRRVGTPGQLLPTVRVGDAVFYGRRMHCPPLSVGPCCGELSMAAADDCYWTLDGSPVTGVFFARDLTMYGFQCIQTFIENDGSSSTLWNTTAVNNAEYGFTLKPWDGSVEDISISAARRNVVFSDVISDGFSFSEYASRHIEIYMAETFSIDASDAYADWGASAYSEMVLDDASEPARGFLCFCEEFLYSKDEFRMDFVMVDDAFSFSDDIAFFWHAQLDDALFFSAWTTPWHCEQVVSILTPTESSTCAVATLVAETFQLDSTDIWDNHFDASDDIFINVSYIFSGHELAEEYLELESDARNGVGIDVFDGILLVDDHHDGWWVELFSSNVGILDDVKTQQWRYVWFMGICIQSWQIDPIEQPGMNDGDHTGALDSDIFG